MKGLIGMFNFKKLEAMEIGQLVALTILFFLIAISVIYFLALAILCKNIFCAVLSIIIIWATKKSAIFDISVDFKDEEKRKESDR